MKKRVFAFLLSAALCFGLVGTASAIGIELDSSGNGMISDGTTTPDPVPTPTPVPTPAPTQRPERPSAPSYNVNNGSGSNDNGSWKADKSTATAGDTVVITVTPKDGQQGKPVVKDAQGGVIALKDLGGGKYSFVMPAGPVTVSVEFTPVVIENPFTDVKPGPYYDAILWAVEKGITTGTGNGTTFSPDNGCTRAQIVTFLYRAFNEPELASAENHFTDVQPGVYYNAILWAVENGITTGTGDGSTFSPGQVCTRAQAVTFLWRAAGEPKPANSVSPFTDVTDPGAFYYDAVLWAVEKGITTGTGNGTTFSPNQPCTRAQIVTFLYRNLAE